MRKVPNYTDGYFELYDLMQDEESDFPIEKVRKRNMSIWFREMSVYDRIRYELSQAGKEVTMKIRIPQYKGIDSQCICKIGDVYHAVYNATHVISKEGFPETELTLVAPEKNLEEYEDDQNGNDGNTT